MARVGPNQDINDPTTILEVGKAFYNKSVNFGTLNAVSTTQNPTATGIPTPTIIIPLKLENGSTHDLYCSRITDEFTVDEPNLGRSVINTYIDLAERFRNYWLTMRTILNNLNDYLDLDYDTVSPHATGSNEYWGYVTGVSGSFGGKSHTEESLIFTTTIPDIPAWSGYGPVNYNYNTYPQLLNVINEIDGSFLYRYLENINEIYYWKYSEGVQSVFGASPSMRIYVGSAFDAGISGIYGGSIVPGSSPVREKLLQIPNMSDSDIDVDIAITADYYCDCHDSFATRREFAQIRIVSGIGNFNQYAGVNLDSTIYQQSYISSFSGVRTINLSITETITIPPYQSIFLTIDSYITTNISTNTGPLLMEGDTLTSIEGISPIEAHAEFALNYP